jgi:radical SAM superfamily enzyme YgiQ (UPF0313 family)
LRARPDIISSEKLAISVSPGEARGRAAIIFPNTYEAGSSNLGFHSVYSLFSAHGYVTERLFVEDGELVCLESDRPLSDYDVVAFSVSYEDDYINVARSLATAGLINAEGGRPSGWPVVISGGVTSSINPEPLAPLVDAVCVGDAETLVPGLADVVSECLAAGSGKADALRGLSKLEGFYVPSIKQKLPIIRQACNVSESVPATSTFVSPYSHFSDAFLIETGRGCGKSCRFCVSRQPHSGAREFSEANIADALKRGRQVAESIGLVGAAVSDHPGLMRILDLAAQMDLTVGVSSLRLERVGEELMEKLLGCGVRSITVAPEAGSERLRRIIGKPVGDETILKAYEIMAGAGVERIKTYLLVGLPWEQDEDLESIPTLVRKLWDICRDSVKTRLAVSMGVFVPKPWTPFQWCGMPESSELARRITIATKGLRRLLKGDLSVDSPRSAIRQAVLSRGGKGVGRALLNVVSGERSFRSALVDEEVDVEHVVHEWRSRSAKFPWDVIDVGVSRERLWKEFESSRKLGEEK